MDVAIVHPAAISYLPKSNTHLAIGRQQEVHKITKYKHFVARMNANFSPLVLESHGSIPPATMTFLKLFAQEYARNNSDNMNTNSLIHILTVLSVTLQIGNAEVLLRGAQVAQSLSRSRRC